MAKRNAHKPKVTATQANVNNVVAQAGDINQGPTPKQMEKARKQEQAYWNGMITRREALDLVKGATAQQDEKLRMLYITTNTLLALIKDLGLATDDKINELSKPFIEMMYGPAPETSEPQEEAVQVDTTADGSTEA